MLVLFTTVMLKPHSALLWVKKLSVFARMATNIRTRPQNVKVCISK